MKKITFLIVSLLVIVSGRAQSSGNSSENSDLVQNFGKKITTQASQNVVLLATSYKTMSISDTLHYKVTAKVNNVCQAKGCWMTLNMENGDEVMVKFKDYGFFVPKDISGKEVIVNGKAFIAEVSVEEQKHYAEDAGKPEAEISKITKPKRTYLFEADGVLLK